MDSERPPEPWIAADHLIGDASTRRYARLVDRRGHTAILVRYPGEAVARFERDLAARSWCEAHGLRVPALLEHRPGSDWAVVEDFGPIDAEQTLRSVHPTERRTLTMRLSEPIVRLGGIAHSELPSWNPPLDAPRLRWELAGFELWFLRHRNRVRPDRRVSDWLDGLAAEIGRHPRRICHRDFHLNNIMFLDSGEVGVIDFQDILVGPDTYDIVSMLFERSMPDLVDAAARADVMEHWARESAAEEGWSHRAGRVRLQRALKVLGTFARLEAAGAAGYVKWLRALAHEVGPELEAAGAPPDVTDLLLDC
jgi:aminoglycoside/choline kinase family phosphotransferase